MNEKMAQHYDAVIVGAGFSGLYLVKRLRDAGFSVIALEAAPSVGGTWYWNTYPGARCDLEVYDYSYSFSRELVEEWDWSERYPSQPELLKYLNWVADRLDLRKDIALNTRVEAASYDEARNLWSVRTGTGEALSARFCIMAGGGLSVPQVPDFPEIDSYKGDIYHTGHWPQSPVDFEGKRVAVIGTGSSGVQVSTTIADDVSQLTVFQRTPNYTVPLLNYPLDQAALDAFRDTAEERFALSRTSRFGVPIQFPSNSALEATPEEREEKYQYAWDNSHLLAYRLTYGDLLYNVEANNTVSEFLRNKIRQIVKDPETAEKLCPKSFHFGTKRPCLGKGYYEMYNQPHVKLVDINETPIVRFTGRGIETAEGELPFAAVVFATGFDALTGAASMIDITGRGGLTLKEKWKFGPEAYLGLATHDFPNLFFVTGPGSPGPLSAMVRSIEQHVEWIGDCLVYMRDHDCAAIEADREAEVEWMDHVQDVVSATLYPTANSWYLGANVPGKPRKFLPYIAGIGLYRQKCDAVADAGYEGFALEREARPATA
ncbi:MAG: flavin-containing monooxygenase [Sphingobium sp.]